VSLVQHAIADAMAFGGYPYGMPGGYEAVLYGELTADGNRIALVAEGSDWGLQTLGGALRQLTPLLEAATDPDGRRNGGLYAPATWATIVQLGFTFSSTPGFAWVPGPRLTDWTIAETIWRTEPEPVPLLAPPRYPPHLKPRDYQLDGAGRIAMAGKFLLLDDMGVGKTVTALLGLDERRHLGYEIFPMVILVPSWDVADAWGREITQWMPHWGTPVMHTGPDRFGKVGRKRGKPPSETVFITTYATARRDAADMRGALVRLRPASTVLDEIHLIKNDDAQQSQAARRVAWQSVNVLGMSGTWITKNTLDAYPPLEALDRWSWPSRKRMKDRYIATFPDGAGYGETVTGLRADRTAEFFSVLAGQVRRVAKADVLDRLPPKDYMVRRPEIPAEWRAAYDQMEADMLAELPEGGELSVMDTLSKLTRLTQLASSAADVRYEDSWDELRGEWVKKQVVKLRPPSWKCDSLLEILAERAGRPTVVFSVSRQLAMIAGQYCEDAGYRTGYITGPGDSPGYRITRRTRRDDIAAFQDGQLDVIIATTGAGGTGITLTRADCVVFLQRPWSLADAIQAEDRCHRIGSEQHESIQVIDVVSRNTVDETVRRALREKAGQLAELVRDPRIVRQLLGGRR
jgi:SNF2 family DNA or RNA helicase